MDCSEKPISAPENSGENSDTLPETLRPWRYLHTFSAKERELMEQEGASIQEEAEQALEVMKQLRRNKEQHPASIPIPPKKRRGR